MIISVLVSSEKHPVVSLIGKWAKDNIHLHTINIIHFKKDLTSGDILFLISCEERVSREERKKYKKTLVIHASDLPKGRGWSPHIWEIINGANYITLSLLEATDEIDAGDIWNKIKVQIPRTALFDEINDIIFRSELKLMNFAIENFNTIEPSKQTGEKPTYWKKRFPSDSEIDIDKKISEQYDLIRVSDPVRFPAFFYKDGVRFNIIIKKDEEK